MTAVATLPGGGVVETGTGTERLPPITERLVNRVSRHLGKRSTRRSFLVKSAVVGSALAVNPLQYVFRPGHRVRGDRVRPRGRLCVGVDGVLLLGEQRPERVPARIHPRRLVEDRQLLVLRWRRPVHPRLQRELGGCGCGSSGICAPGCYNCGCRCNTGSCDQRRHCCNQFRYGQCHQELACVGPVVCRVATCAPPWQWDPTCTTTSATANATALHAAPCLETKPVIEEEEMWVIEKELPAGTPQQPGEVVIGLPANRKSGERPPVRLQRRQPGRIDLGCERVQRRGPGPLGQRQPVGRSGCGRQFVVDGPVDAGAHEIVLQNRGQAGPPTTVTVSGT